MDGLSGSVSRIQGFCVHDGEGIRTTVFLAGCPLRCRWCANPETWEMARGRSMSVEEVVACCEKDRIFYRHSGGGVTISGGEPGMQPRFLHGLVSALADRGLESTLETSGHFAWETMAATLPLFELLFIDVKHMDPDIHRQLTGRDNALILANIARTAALGCAMVIRIPLVHGANDGPENLAATAAFVRATVPGARIELLPYHDWARHKYAALGLAFPEYRRPSEEELKAARTLLAEAGISVVDFK